MSDTVTLTHGGGGRLARRLIEDVIIPGLGSNRELTRLSDGALLDSIPGTPVMTNDCFVVSPREFPGGDIGTLCVSGTVNDLLAAGALPKYLSLGLIIEDGLPIAELRRYLRSIKDSAEKAHVQIVCGDTKVVEHGAADGIFISTTGIGELQIKEAPGPWRLEGRTNNVSIIISGTIGDHSLTLLALRKELALESPVESDCAPLTELVLPIVKTFGEKILCMRDPTRGGLSAVLGEIAEQAKIGIEIVQKDVPINSVVQGACGLLGIDPFTMANEGKMVFFVEEAVAEEVLAALKRNPLGKNAAIIGKTTEPGNRPVYLTTPLGVNRPLEIPLGESLPRIC